MLFTHRIRPSIILQGGPPHKLIYVSPNRWLPRGFLFRIQLKSPFCQHPLSGRRGNSFVCSRWRRTAFCIIMVERDCDSQLLACKEEVAPFDELFFYYRPINVCIIKLFVTSRSERCVTEITILVSSDLMVFFFAIILHWRTSPNLGCRKSRQ